MKQRPTLVLVGGFLGAGKTTLILAAARELARQGIRAAAILNDQGAGLVDTRLAETHGLIAGEVTGGCFCCRLSDLIEAARSLKQSSPDVIFAEPVGSCTDISATTVHPLLRDHFDEFQLAPYTVLVEPARANATVALDADDDLAFLFRKQIEEADLVCLTKADLRLDSPAEFREARRISARSGEGVAAWLDEILGGEMRAGGALLDIDYERYARAEAALAWLNLELELETREPVSPAMVTGPMMDRIASELAGAGIEIAHLKTICECESGVLKAALCGNAGEPDVEGALDASPARRHRLRLNLRARGRPDEVRAIVGDAAGQLPGAIETIRFECFQPAPPTPERRITEMPERRVTEMPAQQITV